MPFNPKMSTLIVDPQPNVRRSIKTMLKTIGLKSVIEAGSAAEALSAIEKQLQEGQEIGFIIATFVLPDMDGIKLTKKIRKTSKAKILLSTTEPSQDRILQGAEVGVNGFIVYPFSAVDLNGKVKQFFK